MTIVKLQHSIEAIEAYVWPECVIAGTFARFLKSHFLTSHIFVLSPIEMKYNNKMLQNILSA